MLRFLDRELVSTDTLIVKALQPAKGQHFGPIVADPTQWIAIKSEFC